MSKIILAIILPLVLGNITVSEYSSLFSKGICLHEDIEGSHENEQSENESSEMEWLFSFNFLTPEIESQRLKLVNDASKNWRSLVYDILTPPPEQ